MHVTRRESFHALGASALAPWVGRGGRVDGADAVFQGMIVRQSEPQNLEMPFAALAEWKVPTERFYIRSHFPVPKIDAKAFQLVVEGHVQNRLVLTLDDLKKFGPVTTPLTMECAGNGRVFLLPAVRGLQWAHGAVGNADWTGIPLGTLLDRAVPKAGAADVVLAGADAGAIAADPATPGPIHFSRGLPLAKARKSEVLLAWGMNGEDLAPAHGFPLRAIVGGWYGMASVKWLHRIVVTDRPYQGYFQTMEYSYYARATGAEPEIVPVTEMQAKAAIARPGPNEALAAGKPYAVLGAAWSGESKVAKVEVSTDGGKTWAAAELDEKPKPFCWVKWSWKWTPTEKGPVKIVAKCTDASSATQPEKRDADRRSYGINHLVPVEVLVR